MLRLEGIDAGYGPIPLPKGATVSALIHWVDGILRRGLPRLVESSRYEALVQLIPPSIRTPRLPPGAFAQVTQVLWDVSLDVPEGSMTIIIGPNGAGKSTLLKVIMGQLRPMRGRIIFDRADITGLPAHARAGRGIAACPEGRRLFPLLTAEQNLLLGAYSPRARASAREVLSQVYALFPRLRERAFVRAGRLSGGEQQMVGIGRALMAKPSIVVLDEPSLGLAPLVVTEIFETIRKLREAGLTVLMVEQNAFQALRIADFAYVIQNGRVVRSGKPSVLLDLEQLRKDYFAIG